MVKSIVFSFAFLLSQTVLANGLSTAPANVPVSAPAGPSGPDFPIVNGNGGSHAPSAPIVNGKDTGQVSGASSTSGSGGAAGSGGSPCLAENTKITEHDSGVMKRLCKIAGACKDDVGAFLKSPSCQNLYSTQGLSCGNAAKMARMACLSSTSPIIQKAAAYLEITAIGVKALTSSKDVCDKTSGMMNVAQAALTAYNTACTALMVRCDFACEYKPSEGTVDSRAAGEETAMQALNGFCGEYKANLVAAGVGLASIYMQNENAKKCEAQIAAQGTGNVNCGDPHQANSPTCICQRNPRSAGCFSGLANDDVGTSSPLAAINGGPGEPAPGTTATPEDPAGASSNAGSSSSGSGSGTASSGGSGVGGSDGSQGAGAQQKLRGSSLNSNIIADYGMGGGGGRRGTASSSTASAAASGKYGSYLPGQSNDPAMANIAAQVSGGGGKSNFEKVRESYTNNRGTLLGE